MISSSFSSLGLPVQTAAAARAARSAGDLNRTQDDGRVQSDQAVRSWQETRELGEGEGDVADRDADGRLPWQAPESGGGETPPENEAKTASPAVRGGRLDFVV